MARGLGADEPRRAGVVLFALGLASLGAGLAEVTGADAWRGKRGTLYRINRVDSSDSWWLTRAGLSMFALTSPLDGSLGARHASFD